MSTHSNLKTTDISTTTAWYTGEGTVGSVSVNDIIQTNGYDLPNDGGGASFAVRAKETGETADNIFTYAVSGYSNLIAELIAVDNTVYAKQFGIKKVSFNENGEPLLTGKENEAAENGSIFSRICMVLPTGCSFTNDLENSIHHFVLEENATYALSNFQISEKSALNIEGNGATLLQYGVYNQSFMQISSCGQVCIHDLTIKCAASGGNNRAAIYESIAGNVDLENVHIESLCNGIWNEDNAQGVFSAKNLYVQAEENGIYCFNPQKMILSYTDIQAEETGIWVNGYGGHFPCMCNHVKIRDASIGISVSSIENSVFRHISLHNTTKAMSISATNSYFSDIMAVGIAKGISFTNSSHVLVTSSLFAGNDVPPEGTANDVFLDTTKNSDNIVVKDCVIDFATKWFSVAHSTQTQATLLFMDCRFLARSLSANNPYPAKVLGGILNVKFLNCDFCAASYPTVTETVGEQSITRVSDDAAMFYFKPSASSVQPHEWDFNDCRFCHETVDGTGGRLVGNSPIWVDAQKDQQYEKTRVALIGCLLEDFNWTTRIYTDNAGSSVVIVNPAAQGTPSENDAQTAVQALCSKERYLSEDNYYLYHTLPQGQTEYCRRAETYGVTA